MVKCSVIVPCRDGEAHLRATLASLTAQTVDVHVTVIDDHSQDGTPEILADFPRVNVIRYPKREKKAHSRIGMLCNMALGVLPTSKYYMVSGDDTEFPTDYVELVTDSMETDGVQIASGHARKFDKRSAPDGSGRIFTAEVWKKITPFHESPAWESGPLLQANFMGYSIAKYPIKKTHLRPKSQDLRRFGHGAHTLGRPIVYTLGRVIKDIVTGNKKPIQAISILVGHLEYWIMRKPRVDYAPQVRTLAYKRVRHWIWVGLVVRPILGSGLWILRSLGLRPKE
jgi:glycosyltransferase involved in cell wall biosynthesis